MKSADHITSSRVRSDRRSLLRRVAASGAAWLAAPVLAGCQILAARDDDRYTVTMTEGRRFEPADLTIPLGSTVVWDNKSNIRHAVSTDASDLENPEAITLPRYVRPFDSGDLFPGDTWALTFTVPGSYVYVCPYHHDKGMIGTVIVEPEAD